MLTWTRQKFLAADSGGGHTLPPPPLAAPPAEETAASAAEGEKPLKEEPAATETAGGEPAATETAGGEPAATEPAKSAVDNLVHLTTEQLNKRLGQAKRVEREGLLRELELPLDANLAEIKEALAEHRKAKDAEKSALEKAKEREAELERKASDAEARAEAVEKELFVERQVRATGWKMRPEFFEVELRLWCEKEQLGPDDDLDDERMARFAKETKAAHPEYFGEAQKPATTGGDGGAPGGGKGSKEKPFNALTATRAELDAYNRQKYGRAI